MPGLQNSKRGLGRLNLETLRGRAERVFYLDLFLIPSSALLASYIRFQFDTAFADTARSFALQVSTFTAIWLGALYLSKAWDERRFLAGEDATQSVLTASWKASILIFATLYLIKLPISRLWVGTMLVSTTLALLISRQIWYLYINDTNRGKTEHRLLVISSRSEFREMLPKLQEKFSNIEFVKQIVPVAAGEEARWLKKCLQEIESNNIDILIITNDSLRDYVSQSLIFDYQNRQISQIILYSNTSLFHNRLKATEVDQLMVLTEPSLLESGSSIKRLLDLLIATPLLVVITPLILLSGLIVKLSDSGPMLFIDQRIGQGGRSFLFPKIRTMRIGSELTRQSHLGRPDSEMSARYASDPRITKIGRILRRWSIDELPQLYCVVIGTMSLVGPRPILKEELPQIESRYQRRFIAKPGLTGLWQVSGRKATTWEERMISDLAYVQNWSLVRDLALILRTIGVIITGKGSL